jgi:hypothetical protein
MDVYNIIWIDNIIWILLVDLFFTPLKNSIRTADEFSSKLPVTDLYGAPLKGVRIQIFTGIICCGQL